MIISQEAKKILNLALGTHTYGHVHQCYQKRDQNLTLVSGQKNFFFKKLELEDEIWTVSQLQHQIKKKLRIFLSPLNIGQIMSKIDSFTNWSTTEIVGTYSVFQQFQPITERLEMIRKKIEPQPLPFRAISEQPKLDYFKTRFK